jgi:hypothetical protein
MDKFQQIHLINSFRVKTICNNIQKAETTDEDILKATKGNKKVKKVMEEFASGKLKSSSGDKVTDRKQAIAIAMSEAGLSKSEMDIESSPKGNNISSVNT